MSQNELPSRQEVDPKLTWDLTPIFASDQAWEEAFEEVKEQIKEVAQYQGTLDQGSKVFQEALEANLDLSRKLESVYVYSHLKHDQDTSNGDYQALEDRARGLLAQAATATAWFQPELLALEEGKVASYLDQNPDLEVYRHELNQQLAKKDHVLDADKEGLLAGASEIFSSGSQTFNILNNADLTFPLVENEEGDQVRLSHGLYGQLLESTDRNVRRQAFEKLYEVYQSFNNTLASTLQTEVKKNNYLARVHNYKSARHQALSNNNIPESVHETLIEVVNENLPLFHRYLALRKKVLDLEELHMYDLYTPIAGESSLKYTFEEAREETYKSLAKLGPDYKAVLDRAFQDRWIDVVENKGKRSGAYSSGGYDTNPYVLLNWHDSLDNLYTLVHELGHSVHSYFTRNNQPYIYGDYPIFLAEIASTTNENLLTHYLLENAQDPLTRVHVLNHYLDGFKGTVFRQTQFAEFEHHIHQAAGEGQPLTGHYLNQTYGELNDRYYGDSVVNDDQIFYEWSRIPHFYMNYYVYQYSTGFCAATALADKLVKEEDGALQAYLGYLKSGDSDYPIEIMKKAGVDMTNKAYIERAMKVFEERLGQLEEALAELKD